MSYFHAVAPAAASSTSPNADLIGVLLINLGTPDAPTYWAVQRYLREFLSDRRVIDTPRLVWLPLLYGVVLPFRPFKTARNYRKIWLPEGSPLGVYSTRLTAKISRNIDASFAGRVRVELAMSYGNPSIERAIQLFAEHGVKKLLVLPLYPQYCSSTTGSAVDGTNRALQRWRYLPETLYINDYYNDERYIDALTAQIERHWAGLGERSHLLLSYHGIPASYVAQGDPYQRQTEATSRLIVGRLKLNDSQWSHCYQSRFGRVTWLQPYTSDAIEDLARRGERRLTVVSPSFAVDCLETLEEVAMEYRDEFLAKGGERLTLVPALNDDDEHAAALTAIIKKRLVGWI